MLISIFASLRSSGSSNKQPSVRRVVVWMLIHTDVKREEEANVKDEEGARGRSRFRQ